MSIRSVLFLLLAAIALAACSDESSPEASVELRDNVTRLGDTVAAEVGETRIYVSDVEREAAAQGAIAPGDRISTDSDAYSRVLDELIDQRLLAMEAARRGLADTDEARRRLQTARERILGPLRHADAPLRRLGRLGDEAGAIARDQAEQRA